MKYQSEEIMSLTDEESTMPIREARTSRVALAIVLVGTAVSASAVTYRLASPVPVALRAQTGSVSVHAFVDAM